MNNEPHSTLRKITKMGMIITIIAALGAGAFYAATEYKKHVDTSAAIADVTETAATASELKIAVINMDQIQTKVKVLEIMSVFKTIINIQIQKKS